MNRKIKSLLKLSRIPGFKLSQDDLKLLEDWKKQQEPIEIVAPKPKRKYTRRKKTTNEAKNKETGVLEIES